MKKLLLLFLLIAGGVSTASADDYWVGGNFNSSDNNWTTQKMSDNGDGTYSLFVNLNAKSLFFGIFTGSEMNWDTNSYRPTSDGPWITNSVQEIDVRYPGDDGYNSSNNAICYPTIDSGAGNWNAASAIRIVFNPSTKKVSVSRFISVPNGYNGWSTTTDYLPETTFGSMIYSGNVALQADTDGQDDGFKFYYINSIAEYGGKNGDNFGNTGSNYDVAEDGVYTLTADFTDWHWTDPVRVTTTASVGTYGMATLCSEYALDFTGITDVKAYTITANDKATGGLTKSQVTGQVPARTGLYIEGAANASADVPTTIYTTSAGTNMLVGVTSETKIDQIDGSNTNYILTINRAVGGDAASPKFYKVNSKGNTVLAGKAYLQIPTTLAAREAFWFDEETTAVDTVKQEQKFDGKVYNLAGQRIAQPTKGMYIVNGKKVVIK